MTASVSSVVPLRDRITSLLMSRNFMPGCFLVYMALRASVLFVAPVYQFTDFLWYYHAAIAIATGNGYSDNGFQTAFWPVGWPGLLGILFRLFGSQAIVGKLANLIFSALTFIVTAAVARRLFGDRLVVRLTVLLLTVYPNQIAYIPALATETFYEFLLLLAVWLLSKERVGWIILAGIVFGIASLTKAQTPPIPIVLLVGAWLLTRPRPGVIALAARIAAVVIMMALVIAPWTFRNHQVFGAFVPISTNGGEALLKGNNPNAKGNNTEHGPLLDTVPMDPRKQIVMDRLAGAEAMHWIESHPLKFLKLLPRKVWYLWAIDGEGEWLFEAGYPGFQAHELIFDLVRIANQLYYLALLALAAASLIPYTQQFSRTSPWAASGWILIAYFTAISLVFSGQARYHFPLMPWVAMYAAMSLARWLGAKAARSVTGSPEPENPKGVSDPLHAA